MFPVYRIYSHDSIALSPFQDKILQSTGRGHSITVTNDGATILKSLHVDNPAAKVLVGILHNYVHPQDESVGCRSNVSVVRS